MEENTTSLGSFSIQKVVSHNDYIQVINESQVYIVMWLTANMLKFLLNALPADGRIVI